MNKTRQEDLVILVDEKDNEVGMAGKAEAHRNGGRLHRAFSVLVFNPAGALLVQQRAAGKPFSGLWANTCCSHPRPGESVEVAAHRRLKEEMGFDCPLEEKTSFTYRADSGGGYVEHELDHVLTGRYDGRPEVDPAEVADWRWAKPSELRREMAHDPDAFAPWFRLIIERERLESEKQQNGRERT